MKKAHFIGICGKGMSAVAKLLMEDGWQVTGSDEGFYPPISTYLEANNIPCTPYYAAGNIPHDATVIIIGKHAKLVVEENEEVAAAFASGIPIKSFPDILNDLTAKTSNYVAVGSFGKSTCTSLATWALVHAGKDPSYFIGAIALNLPTNAKLGSGSAFVLEGDEYPSANWDSNAKFLYYNANTILLTSGEHDHVNVFPTIESYLEPFIQLILQLPEQGQLVACLDGANVATILEKTGRRAITYSLSNHQADWWADQITYGSTTSFDLIFRTQKICRIESCLLGDHNVQNMVGVAAWLLSNDAITPEELRAAFRDFKGVVGRLELKTQHTIIPVYEDFGSSRAKALAGFTTLRKQFPDKRIIAVFEPHTFSWRNRQSLEWYNDLFDDTDVAFIYEPPTHGASSHDQLTQDEIVQAVKKTGKETYAIGSKEELLHKLTPMLRANDLIVMTTSSDLGGSITAVTDYVQKQFPTP